MEQIERSRQKEIPMLFEDLQAILLGFANEPINPDYSDPRYIPVREDKDDDVFAIRLHGYPDNYDAWISPHTYHSNTGWMGIQVQKSVVVTCVTLRVVAYNAYTTYEYKFNFGEGQPALEMRQGLGVNITGERVRFRPVHCIDLVIFDLLELMLPPRLKVYKPEVNIRGWGVYKKPCILCGTDIPNNHHLCADCHPANKVVASV